MPHCTSSNTRSSPCSLQSARRSRRNCPDTSRIPPSPCTGSITIAAVSGPIAAVTAFRSPSGTWSKPSGRGPRPSVYLGLPVAASVATGNPKYTEGLGPLPEGFDQVPLGDLKAVTAAIGPETAAIVIEPVQGEGGIRLVSGQFLRDLQALCDEHGLLLVFDEVQCGMGRTGKLFAYEWSGVAPDVMAVAKGLGGGFPVGACLATADAAKGMTLGIHGTTFGGNPLAMAVAKTAVDIISDEGRAVDAERHALGGLHLKQRLA